MASEDPASKVPIISVDVDDLAIEVRKAEKFAAIVSEAFEQQARSVINDIFLMEEYSEKKIKSKLDLAQTLLNVSALSELWGNGLSQKYSRSKFRKMLSSINLDDVTPAAKAIAETFLALIGKTSS